MAAPRLRQFLSERNYEHNRGAFAEIAELEEENINSEMLSKPSFDHNNPDDLSNDDLSYNHPITPKSFNENSSYDLEEDYPASSKVLKPPLSETANFKKPEKMLRKENRAEIDNSIKVTPKSNISFNEDTELELNLHGLPESGKHISFSNKDKQPPPPLAEKMARSMLRSKSKPVPSASVVSKLFQNRPSKDIAFPKQNSARAPNLHFETINTTKRGRRDNPISARTNSHSANQRKRVATESGVDFKVDERLKEFKMLKDSFLKSLFNKSREDNAKQGIRGKSIPKANSDLSFEERLKKSSEPTPKKPIESKNLR